MLAGPRTKIASIDGRPAKGSSFEKYEVLPGQHVMVIKADSGQLCMRNSGLLARHWVNSCFVTQPGRSYSARCYDQEEGPRRAIIDETLGRNVMVRCPESTVSSPAVAPAAASEEVAEASDLPTLPPPLVWIHLGFGWFGGGDDLATATYTNGSTDTLSAGDGLFVYLGTSAMPVWIENAVGFGVGGSIGWKRGSVGDSSASLEITRFPLDIWVQALIRATDRWYFSLLGGTHKEYGASLGGTGVDDVPLTSPVGWMSEIGFYGNSKSFLGWGFGFRITRVHYAVGSVTLDGNNLGLVLSLHAGP